MHAIIHPICLYIPTCVHNCNMYNEALSSREFCDHLDCLMLMFTCSCVCVYVCLHGYLSHVFWLLINGERECVVMHYS